METYIGIATVVVLGFFGGPWIMLAIEATCDEWVQLIRKFRGK